MEKDNSELPKFECEGAHHTEGWTREDGRNQQQSTPKEPSFLSSLDFILLALGSLAELEKGKERWNHISPNTMPVIRARRK